MAEETKMDSATVATTEPQAPSKLSASSKDSNYIASSDQLPKDGQTLQSVDAVDCEDADCFLSITVYCAIM